MKKKLICELKNTNDLKVIEKSQMFSLFSNYYSNVSSEQFEKDLKSKDDIFLLKDKFSNEVKGFSTIVNLNIEIQDKMVRGCFSGDTVIDKEYWGQATLGVNFLLYLFKQKLKRPFNPLYWFLISKGYKTYLLMANNFKTHYPRFEQETPKYEQDIIDSFSNALYSKHYDKDKGIISFSGHKANTKDCLKANITPISADMLLKNPRINFFAQKNPNWEQGDELACIAKMNLSMPFYYAIKKALKQFKPKIKDKYINLSEVES